MWTPETRARHERRDLRYPSDLRDAEWEILEPHLPKPAGVGRPRTHSVREIINGIRYVLRYGIPWDALPKDLPPHRIVHDFYRAVAADGDLEQLNHLLPMRSREAEGRAAGPSAAILDSQTVKCDAPQGERGHDGAKRMVGRKRHVAVDTGGRVLATLVSAADVTDREAGKALADEVCRRCPWVEVFIVDSAYKEGFRDHIERELGRRVDVVRRLKGAEGFVPLPKRWKVEQTLGVLVMCRRLRTDYETLLDCSAALLMLASMFRMITGLPVS